MVRIALWVRPGSARPGVGGEHNGALVVRVSAPAVGGQATEAALAAVAAAFGVRRRAVTLVAGAVLMSPEVAVASGGEGVGSAPVSQPRDFMHLALDLSARAD